MGPGCFDTPHGGATLGYLGWGNYSRGPILDHLRVILWHLGWEKYVRLSMPAELT